MLRGLRVRAPGGAPADFALELLAGLGATVAGDAGADIVLAADAGDTHAPGEAIVVSCTPFGADGPRTGWRGGERIAQAAGGIVWPNGVPGAPPLPFPGALATRAAGLHAALGAVLALHARRRGGRRLRVDISLQESAAALLEQRGGEWFDAGRLIPRQGSRHPSGTFQVARCRDGWALLTHVGDWDALREWLRADGMAGDLAAPRWNDLETRCREAEHVFAVLADWAAAQRVADLVAAAQLRRLPFAPVQSFAECAAALGHVPGPDVLARELLPPRADVRGSAPRPADGSGAPLGGIRVLDLTWVVAGPLATRVLADFGADVLHIERPDVAARRRPGTVADANLHRGKRHRTLDLRHAADRATLRTLIADADVLVDNFSRRVLPNLGFDDEALLAINPRLVIAHLRGCPASGPYTDWTAYGPTLHALSGLTAAMAAPDGTPAGPGFACADTLSAWAAALSIAAALWRRATTGVGACLEIVQLEVLALLLAPLLRGDAPTEPGALYRCADDPRAPHPERWCLIDDTTPAWMRFTTTLDQPSAAWLRTTRAEDAVEFLQAAGVGAALVATIADLAADPQLRHRGWWPGDGVVPRLRVGEGAAPSA